MTNKSLSVNEKGTIYPATEKPMERSIQVGSSRVLISDDSIEIEAEHVIINGVEVG